MRASTHLTTTRERTSGALPFLRAVRRRPMIRAVRIFWRRNAHSWSGRRLWVLLRSRYIFCGWVRHRYTIGPGLGAKMGILGQFRLVGAFFGAVVCALAQSSIQT